MKKKRNIENKKKYRSQEEPKNEEAQGYERAHDDTVPPLLGRYPPNQRVDPRHLRGGEGDAAVDARERLGLEAETVAHGVRLAEHAVGHVVAAVDAPALLQHVLCLGRLRVARAVGVNVVAHRGEQVRAVARLRQRALQPRKVFPVLRKLLSEERQVVLLQRRGREGRFRVEEPRELADDFVSLLLCSASSP